MTATLYFDGFIFVLFKKKALMYYGSTVGQIYHPTLPLGINYKDIVPSTSMLLWFQVLILNFLGE